MADNQQGFLSVPRARRMRAPTITIDTTSVEPSMETAPPADTQQGFLTVPQTRRMRASTITIDTTSVEPSMETAPPADTEVTNASQSLAGERVELRKDPYALTPDPGTEDMYEVEENKFAFTRGQLSKLINPKSLRAFHALGGLKGLEKGLRTDRYSGLSVDETTLGEPVSSEENRLTDTYKYGGYGDTTPRLEGDHSGHLRLHYHSNVKNRLHANKTQGVLEPAWIAYNEKVLQAPATGGSQCYNIKCDESSAIGEFKALNHCRRLLSAIPYQSVRHPPSAPSVSAMTGSNCVAVDNAHDVEDDYRPSLVVRNPPTFYKDNECPNHLSTNCPRSRLPSRNPMLARCRSSNVQGLLSTSRKASPITEEAQTVPANEEIPGDRRSDVNELQCGLIKTPEARPISQEQLVAEVKGIYAGLVMVESKCIEVDDAQNADNNEPATKRMSNEEWQALIALHRTLLHEHHDFFLASQRPSANPARRRLASKYAMPARMWRHGIHSFLEVLRYRFPPGFGHMLAFIYLAYSMMALLYTTVPSFNGTWMECLGNLGRYRMAIEDDNMRDREVWTRSSRRWYVKALKKSRVGRFEASRIVTGDNFAFVHRGGLQTFQGTPASQFILLSRSARIIPDQHFTASQQQPVQNAPYALISLILLAWTNWTPKLQKKRYETRWPTGLLLVGLGLVVAVPSLAAPSPFQRAARHIAAGTSISTSLVIPALRLRDSDDANNTIAPAYWIASYSVWAVMFAGSLILELVRCRDWIQRRLLVFLALVGGLNLLGSLREADDGLAGVIAWAPLSFTTALCVISALVDFFGMRGVAAEVAEGIFGL